MKDLSGRIWGDSVEETGRRDRDWTERRILYNKKQKDDREARGTLFTKCWGAAWCLLPCHLLIFYASLVCMLPVKQEQHNSDGSGVLFDHWTNICLAPSLGMQWLKYIHNSLSKWLYYIFIFNEIKVISN